ASDVVALIEGARATSGSRMTGKGPRKAVDGGHAPAAVFSKRGMSLERPDLGDAWSVDQL
ncbi:MAG: hypothetical protein ACRC4O_01240, partial [Giesbergeria sp.]